MDVLVGASERLFDGRRGGTGETDAGGDHTQHDDALPRQVQRLDVRVADRFQLHPRTRHDVASGHADRIPVDLRLSHDQVPRAWLDARVDAHRVAGVEPETGQGFVTNL